jgi:hypothetical protein
MADAVERAVKMFVDARVRARDDAVLRGGACLVAREGGEGGKGGERENGACGTDGGKTKGAAEGNDDDGDGGSGGVGGGGVGGSERGAVSFDAVRCFVLGDGKTPMGAAALALRLPETWQYVSIDPLAEEAFTRAAGAPALGGHAERIEVFAGLSQEYEIVCAEAAGSGDHSSSSTRSSSSSPPPPALLSVVVACHSHAPLAEFWSRVPAPKVAVTMACCADFSDLEAETPVMEFDDYEVYSPKRRVKIFFTDV